MYYNIHSYTKESQLSLSSNPSVNTTSAHSPRSPSSNQKSFQNFQSINTTAQTALPTSQNFSAAYIINSGTGATNMTALLSNLGVLNFGFTAFIVSYGNHEVWATRTAVPTTGLPPGTTWFTEIYFDGNELLSSGDMTQGGATGGPWF